MPVLPVASDGTLGAGNAARTHHVNAERSSGDNLLTASIAAASSALIVGGLDWSPGADADGSTVEVIVLRWQVLRDPAGHLPDHPPVSPSAALPGYCRDRAPWPLPSPHRAERRSARNGVHRLH